MKQESVALGKAVGPQLNFRSTVSMILEEGHVYSTMASRAAYIKEVLVDEAKEVCSS